jgi:hypothetical protein
MAYTIYANATKQSDAETACKGQGFHEAKGVKHSEEGQSRSRHEMEHDQLKFEWPNQQMEDNAEQGCCNGAL